MRFDYYFREFLTWLLLEVCDKIFLSWGPFWKGKIMTLTREDLQAIAGIVNENVQDIREDIKNLKEDVSDLKEEVSALKEDVSDLKEEASALKEDVSDLKERMSDVEHDVKDIKVVKLENNVIPVLNTIHRCYVDTYERYRVGAERFEGAFIEIDAMKTTIERHSKQIKELELKQA